MGTLKELEVPRPDLALVLLVLLVPVAAPGADGVSEINQACALAGCFAGDPAGFPVVITQPGSYRLTGNLDVGVAPVPADTTAIEIAASEVSIDLAGFTITGRTVCGTFGACTGAGNGSGIIQTGGIRERISIRDGVIRGMGRYGIACDVDCSVERVAVEGNGNIGILVFNEPARIQANIVRNNGGDGIYATGSILENVVDTNNGVGVRERGKSVIARNRVNGNAGGGVICGYGTLVLDNFLGFNSVADLKVESGAVCALGRNTLTGTLDATSGSIVQVDANLCGSDLVCP